MKRLLQTLCLAVMVVFGARSAAGSAVPPPSHPVAVRTAAVVTSTPEALIVCILVVGVGVITILLVGVAVALQFPRTLEFDPCDDWAHPQYARSLSNALAVLAERKCASVWPRHCTPWSMNRFQRQLVLALREEFGCNAKRFARQHLSLWKWMISHREGIEQLLQWRERRHALELLTASTDSQARGPLLAVINKEIQQSDSERVLETQWCVPQLDRVQMILREHGYSLGPAFEAMDRLAQESVESFSEKLAA